MPRVNNNLGCTIGTCPLTDATILYIPSLGGNAFYLAAFALIFFIQAFQLWRYRTWSFSCSMMVGLVLEVVGYVGRVQMHFNPFLPNPFLIYIICLTIGPVFFSAAVYLTLSRIIVHYGVRHARISPKAITLIFITCDFVALVLQATGGAIADTAATARGSQQGTHIMVGGLAFQVLSLLLFIALATEFALNVKRDRRVEGTASKEAGDINGHSEKSFKHFLFAWACATILILTRSCFRVAELAKGFGSKLANQQVPFMVLEGAMIVLATATMTSFHPGHAFGDKWGNAGWSWKKGKVGEAEAEAGPGSDSQPPSMLKSV